MLNYCWIKRSILCTYLSSHWIPIHDWVIERSNSPQYGTFLTHWTTWHRSKGSESILAPLTTRVRRKSAISFSMLRANYMKNITALHPNPQAPLPISEKKTEEYNEGGRKFNSKLMSVPEDHSNSKKKCLQDHSGSNHVSHQMLHNPHSHPTKSEEGHIGFYRMPNRWVIASL